MTDPNSSMFICNRDLQPKTTDSQAEVLRKRDALWWRAMGNVAAGQAFYNLDATPDLSPSVRGIMTGIIDPSVLDYEHETQLDYAMTNWYYNIRFIKETAPQVDALGASSCSAGATAVADGRPSVVAASAGNDLVPGSARGAGARGTGPYKIPNKHPIKFDIPRIKSTQCPNGSTKISYTPSGSSTTFFGGGSTGGISVGVSHTFG